MHSLPIWALFIACQLQKFLRFVDLFSVPWWALRGERHSYLCPPRVCGTFNKTWAACQRQKPVNHISIKLAVGGGGKKQMRKKIDCIQVIAIKRFQDQNISAGWFHSNLQAEGKKKETADEAICSWGCFASRASLNQLSDQEVLFPVVSLFQGEQKVLTSANQSWNRDQKLEGLCPASSADSDKGERAVLGLVPGK